jgi:tRNA uridine 5-carbamoylmethylation protein Kti12
MPCLIITGHPSAGKTTLAYLLKERALLHDDIDEVVVVNEESECGCCLGDDGTGNDNKDETPNKEKNKDATTKQELYETAFAEKQTRAALKSGFDRAVKKSSSKNNSRRLVILDSLNYIKGFRYELHCISKAAGEKHGVLWVLNRSSVVQQWNKCSTTGSNSHSSSEKKNNQQRYSTELLQELISRYEPPDSRNRWDQPLFTVDIATAARSDALPASNNHEEVVPIKNELSTRNEVLKQSVYNMHSLGDAFGASATVQTNDSNLQPTESSFAPPATSRTTKPPKKSAFQRKKKITPSDRNKKKIVVREDDECNSDDIPTSIGTCPVSNSIIGSEKTTVDRIPTSNNIMMRSDADESSDCGTSTPKPPKQPSSQTQQTSSNKPLEEQLDEILDIFLLKTSNLKEGMSTRQYV